MCKRNRKRRDHKRSRMRQQCRIKRRKACLYQNCRVNSTWLTRKKKNTNHHIKLLNKQIPNQNLKSTLTKGNSKFKIYLTVTTNQTNLRLKARTKLTLINWNRTLIINPNSKTITTRTVLHNKVQLVIKTLL